MLKIKLSPRGKKHQISYRIVITPDRSKSNGNFIDDIGFYTPQSKTLKINQEKLKTWQKKGAQVTLGLDKLLNPGKYPPKPRKVKKQEENPIIATPLLRGKQSPPEKPKTEKAPVAETETSPQPEEKSI